MATTKKAAIVTTDHRGVFFGYLPTDYTPGQPDIILTKVKVAIRWGTTKGLGQLAATGPTSTSRIGAEVPSWELRGVESVLTLTQEAEAAWKNA